MTIDPTREEWLAARERLLRWDFPTAVHGYRLDNLTTAVLGPCPPEPVPEEFRKGYTRMVKAMGEGKIGITADEADVMADALREHARSERERNAARRCRQADEA